MTSFRAVLRYQTAAFESNQTECISDDRYFSIIAYFNALFSVVTSSINIMISFQGLVEDC